MSFPEARTRAALLAAVVCLPLLLHFQHLGPGRIPYLRDLSRTHLAYKQEAVAAMRSGRLPLLLPGHGAGTPLLADANYFHFHPATLPFLLLPFGTAFSLTLAALSVAAAAGTCLWLRARGLTRAGAAVGGLAFALGGVGASIANLYNLLASYAAVPWVLWAAARYRNDPSLRPLAAIAIPLSCTLLGGEPSAWAWALLFAVALGDLGLRRAIPVALLSIAIASAQLLPLAEATRGAARGRGFTLAGSAYHSLPPARLAELILPFPFGDPTRPWPPEWRGAHLAEGGMPFLFSLYLGISVALLLVAGLVRRQRGRERPALLFLGSLSLLLALGRYTPLFPWLWQLLPPLQFFRYPSKFLLGFALVAAALAARGTDWLLSRAPRLPAFAPALLVAADLLAAHLRLVPGAPSSAFLTPPALAASLVGHRCYFWLEPDRWASAERERLAYHRDYQERLVPPAGLPFGVSYVFDPDPDQLDPERMVALGTLFHASDGNRERLLPLLAADRVIAPRSLAIAGLEPLPAPIGQLYRVGTALPYARVVAGDAVRPARDTREALALLRDPGFDPLRSVVFEGSRPHAGAPSVPTLERPRPERIVATAEGPGLLVLAEAWSAAWRVTIDGRPATAAPANVAFLGVVLPPGRHRVELAYRPPGLAAGLWISAIALCLSLVLLARRGASRPVLGHGLATEPERDAQQ